MTVHSKRSRWARCPTGKAVILSPRDFEIFKLLNRYRYLRSSTLIAFFAKRDTSYLQRRLADLYHEQPYLSRFNTRKKLPNADHQGDVYELGNLGRQALTHNGVHLYTADHQAGCLGEFRNFQHALMICDILASVELGCIQKGLRFITWEEIMLKALPIGPVDDWPYKIWAPLEGKEYSLIPDALFGIEYPDKRFRFFALEADRGTESLTRKNYYQTSYKKKLLLYRSILTLRTHETHWKIPNLYVLNVTTSAERMENIKKLTLDITEGRGNSVMLFKVHKGTAFSGPPADGHVLTEPWGRAGYPMFDISVSDVQAFTDKFFPQKVI